MSGEPGWLTERHRCVLRGLAMRLCLDPRLRPRFDESDIVQEALARAWEKREQCRGTTDPERMKWLTEILHTVFLDRVDRELAGKRNPDLERSIPGRMQESSDRLNAWLAAEQSSPSQQAQHLERDMQVAAALQALPDDQRTAVTLRYLVGMTLHEVADQMGRTVKSVNGLLDRGKEALRASLPDSLSFP
jgi:RNA polymerase sigma-70 factor (ECF subfamily)